MKKQMVKKRKAQGLARVIKKGKFLALIFALFLLIGYASYNRVTEMPVMFVSHGGPNKAFDDSCYGDSFSEIPDLLPGKPKAILMISAHWLSDGTLVSCSVNPETIHDYSGFSPELSKFSYDAKGDRELALKIAELVDGECVDRGFDHGAWTVLNLMYPDANIPVIQMSIDYTATNEERFNIAKKLRSLRSEGVLIIGSGTMTHNLRAVRYEENATPVYWAKEFDDAVVSYLNNSEFEPLIEFNSLPYATMAHPTPDHYWPLIYVIGASEEGDKVSYPYAKFEYGIFSNRNVMFSK